MKRHRRGTREVREERRASFGASQSVPAAPGPYAERVAELLSQGLDRGKIACKFCDRFVPRGRMPKRTRRFNDGGPCRSCYRAFMAEWKRLLCSLCNTRLGILEAIKDAVPSFLAYLEGGLG